MEFRSAYGKRKRLRKKPVGTTRTKQSFAKECDINNILQRFSKTGVFDHLSASSPQYGVVEGSDLHTLMNVVAEANSTWEGLPGGLRERFETPQELVAFVGDESNRDEAMELGLVEPFVAGVPVEVRVIPDEAPEGPVVAPDGVVEPPAHIPT